MCKFTSSNGFNKCVLWKLRLLEPTPLYSFVISLLNLTFAYFFMLNCENTEVIRWPLFSRIPRCNAILWQYLWTAYRDTPISFFKKTCLKSLRLLNGVKSERKECERVEKRVTDINIYRWGCQTAATTVSLWLWMRSTGRKNQIKLEIKWILPQVTNIKYTSNKHICKVHSRGIFLSCVAYSMDIYSRKPCVCISASVFG